MRFLASIEIVGLENASTSRENFIIVGDYVTQSYYYSFEGGVGGPSERCHDDSVTWATRESNEQRAYPRGS